MKIRSGVKQVSAGNICSMYILNDGTLWGCGNNDYGKIGVGTKQECVKTPTQILSGVRSVITASNHTLAILNNGTLMAWGSNFDGALGDGTKIHRRKPVKIHTNVSKAASGDTFTVFITNDGNFFFTGSFE